MIRYVLCFCAALSLQAATPLFQNQSNDAWTPLHGSAVYDDSVRHNNNRSVRVEATSADADASARSSPIHLTIGKTYEISGWVRTEDLTIKDLDRSPISSGAALTMESMPFDVHSPSLGGTHDWTRLSLRFVATRSEDHILVTAGNGGALQEGKAWFEGVSIDEASPADSWPSRDAVRTFGPAYRYPAAGWIYLHIEGKPYDRGYQHGYLMAKEIPEYLTRCAIELGGKADEQTWNSYRTAADALFLRGFDREILEEMRGIADGADTAGAKFLGRKLDLIDIVLANTTVEMGELASAMRMTPTGLEGTHFNLPPYASHDASMDHCSAFAATGPATRDGKMVIGHVTWWPQTLAEQTNVMLDIKPETGHRMLIQSYPGGIESGTDWYQNDAGVVLTETTIEQSPFNIQGTPVAFRARMAIQYGGNIDEVVKQLGTRNNGLYTNEWIIGDAKNNEIAMYELGTNHTKLWRSSMNEWFGDTPGFYWGDNNAKDLAVNLEYVPDPQGAPGFIPYVPGTRDLAWMDLYKRYKGQIDEQFGFKAFDRPPLISAATMDAKVVTADMANRMMVWAEFGRPNESVAAPRGTDYGLFPGGYYLFNAEAPPALTSSPNANDAAQLKSDNRDKAALKSASASWHDRSDKLWKGWILPASETDVWFVAGSAEYYRLLQSEDVDEAMTAQKIRYRGLKLSPDTPMNHFRLQQTAGTLFLDSLRHKMGDGAFLKLMDSYFAANTTKTVTAQSFLDEAKVKYTVPDPGDGPAYLPGDIARRTESAVIVYGTAREAGTNRYVAEQLQAHYRERAQRDIPIYKDYETSDSLLATKDVIFVGRPETNSALASWSSNIGLDYQGAVFKVDGKTYASERNALVYAAKNPRDSSHMVLVYAGNSPLETARASQAMGQTPAIVLEDDKSEDSGGDCGQLAAQAACYAGGSVPRIRSGMAERFANQVEEKRRRVQPVSAC